MLLKGNNLRKYNWFFIHTHHLRQGVHSHDLLNLYIQNTFNQCLSMYISHTIDEHVSIICIIKVIPPPNKKGHTWARNLLALCSFRRASNTVLTTGRWRWVGTCAHARHSTYVTCDVTYRPRVPD